MSKFLKIILFIILIIGLSFDMCYAIDENLTNNLISGQNVAPIDETNEYSEDVQNENVDITTNDETYSTSTTISDASNVSNNSTITNILIIALLVIGFLLILLAIAILIRLKR